MTSEEMDKIIKERRAQARELNISGKAGKIAFKLGTKHPKNHGAVSIQRRRGVKHHRSDEEKFKEKWG